MTKVQNHRSKLQAKTTKRKPSKSRRQNNSLKFWCKKALAVADVFKQIKDLSSEVEEVKKEKEEVESQLEVAKRELGQADHRYQALVRKTKKDKNKVLKLNSERWQCREKELKEKYEQQVEEWMQECEDQEMAHVEAERELNELKEEIETVYMNLFGNS